MPEVRKKSARIEARITPDALAVVKRAAEIQGRSISEFVVASASEVAERTIRDTQIVQTSVADQEFLYDLLANPREPKGALKRAIEAHKRRIVSK